MEPGFLHLGWREGLAVWLAVVIIADWAATRYGSPRARHSSAPGTGSGAPTSAATSEPPPRS